MDKDKIKAIAKLAEKMVDDEILDKDNIKELDIKVTDVLMALNAEKKYFKRLA